MPDINFLKMKKVFLFGITILLSSVTSIVLFSYLTGEPTYSKSVIQTHLYSTILHEERKVIIHLPEGYDKSKSYPVVYVLDGSSQDKQIANKFNILSTAGYVQKTIIVGLPNVSGEGRQRDYTPPYMRRDIDEKKSLMGAGDQFLSFMENELFPFIEKGYSVSKIRSFAGNSRGGLLVMYSLLYKPDLFRGRFCFSPAFWRDNNLIVRKVADFLKRKDSLHTFLYMSMGSKENKKMKNGFNKMTEVLRKETHKDLVWYSTYTPSADHHNNAEISASAGIRKWTDYLRSEQGKLLQ